MEETIILSFQIALKESRVWITINLDFGSWTSGYRKHKKFRQEILSNEATILVKSTRLIHYQVASFVTINFFNGMPKCHVLSNSIVTPISVATTSTLYMSTQGEGETDSNQ